MIKNIIEVLFFVGINTSFAKMLDAGYLQKVVTYIIDGSK